MAEALAGAWRRLSFEGRAAAVGSVLLVVSTFGPFSWVEAAIVLTGLSVLFGLRQRAVGKSFHLPAADGTLIAAAGGWAALLIAARLFDRPLGQNLLALACAAILVAAGARERARQPAEDETAVVPPHRSSTEAAPAQAPTEKLPPRRT
ncbi:MAG: hypothetical protein H0V57_00670 [Thermoleophilaceae bacterium]|nr:hypothetical protein [Thermoleophilaceae bacterium]